MTAVRPGGPEGPPLITADLAVPGSALAIGAHPDDVEFGCGATLAKWAAAGCVVHHLVLTDGSKGTWDAAADIDALVTERQHEQRAAAAALGATGEVVFLGQVDGELESTMALRSEVAAVIRRLRPQVVLGHDPWKRHRLHPDHRHAGWLTADAVVAARDPHFFPEHGLAHHRPEHLLLFEADEVNHIEDVGAHLDAKVDALLEHRSQHRSTMFVEDGDPAQVAEFTDAVRARAEQDATRAGGDHPQIRLAEAFQLIATD